MAISALRTIVNQMPRAALEEGCRNVGLPYSGRPSVELCAALSGALNFELKAVRRGEVFFLDTLNEVAENAGGVARRSFREAVDEILNRVHFGEEEDEEAARDQARERGKPALAGILRSPVQRAMHLREHLRGLPPPDRELFFRLARNRPGPGCPILVPERNGFVALRNLSAGAVQDALEELDGRMTRESAFERAITLAHQLAPNFIIYVGRTYERRGEEHRGLMSRWTSHWQNKNMTYARVLARSPRGRVERDELIAIRLVKLWEEFGMLCCNNNVIDPAGGMADDTTHVLYMCIRRK